LEQNFRSKYIKITHGFFEGLIAKENLEWHLNNSNSIKAIGGHRISFDVPYGHKSFDVRCIAYVRDPIERFVSEYHYVRKLKLSGIASDSRGLEDFLDKLEDCPKDNWYINTQSKFQTLPEPKFQELVKARSLLVLPTEKFNQSLILIKSIIPELKNISYICKNINHNKPKLVSDDLRERIADLNMHDITLYNSSLKLFDELRNDFEGDIESAERRLKRGSNIRKIILSPVYSTLKSLSSRVNSINP
jgi:hypothetical protein